MNRSRGCQTLINLRRAASSQTHLVLQAYCLTDVDEINTLGIEIWYRTTRRFSILGGIEAIRCLKSIELDTQPYLGQRSIIQSCCYTNIFDIRMLPLTNQNQESCLIGYDNGHLATTYETNGHCCISKSENIKHSFKFKRHARQEHHLSTPIPCVSILGTLGFKGLKGQILNQTVLNPAWIKIACKTKFGQKSRCPK